MSRYDKWMVAEPPGVKIITPEQALQVVLPFLVDSRGRVRREERFVVVGISAASEIVGKTLLTRGSDRLTVVDPAQVFRWALMRHRSVTAIIVAHNHPSGSPEPSDQDDAVTVRLHRAGEMLGVRLLDHLVVGSRGRFTSYREMGRVL